MALDPVTAALDIGGKLIDRFFPDPAQRDAAKLELLRLQQAGELAQVAVNQAEAANPSVFVSGWRPGMGWICVAACGWNWLGLPIAKLAAAYAGHDIPLSQADLTEMLPVLMGMLGLGGLRSWEKINGAAAK
jgi:hypothetical protein